MRQIYKYPLKMVTELFLTEPKFLHVGVQNGATYFWAEVEIDRGPNEKYTLTVVATGDTPPDNAEFIGTFFSDEQGTFVWHVYVTKGN